MKKSNYLLGFRKDNKLSAIAVLFILFVVILGCGGSKPETPKEAEVQSIVKATLTDFTDGIDKADFSDFRSKWAKEFQDQYSNEQMKTAFKSMIDAKDRAVPILRSANGMNLKFSEPPSIREDKNGNYFLVAKGEFDTTPLKTTINNEYLWRDGAWKLSTIETFLK